MNNEIEEIVDLFDEFFIIDSPDNPGSKQPAEHAVINLEPAEKEVPELPGNISSVPAHPSADPAPQPQLPSFAPLNFSGANKRHITVIYNDKNNDSRENVEMLSNLITKALKFSMDDVAIVRLSRNGNYTLSMIFNALETKHALIWGARDLLLQENIGADIHTCTQLGPVKLMIADEAHTYHGNTAYKTKLWEAIQALFNS